MRLQIYIFEDTANEKEAMCYCRFIVKRISGEGTSRRHIIIVALWTNYNLNGFATESM